MKKEDKIKKLRESIKGSGCTLTFQATVDGKDFYNIINSDDCIIMTKPIDVLIKLEMLGELNYII